MNTVKTIAVTLLAFSVLSFAPISSAKENQSDSANKPDKTAFFVAAEACVGLAVVVREDAASTAYTAFSTAISAAMRVRKTDLVAAYNSAKSMKDLRAGINKAESKFRSARKAALAAFRKARNEAWSAFSTARKACGAPLGESMRNSSSEAE